MSAGRLKAGPITVALGLIVIGGALLVQNVISAQWLGSLWKWWPLLLVGLGLEFLVKDRLHKQQGLEGDVRFHWPSVVMIIVLSGGIFVGTAVNKVMEWGGAGNWNISSLIGGFSAVHNFTSAPIEVKGSNKLMLDHHVGRVQLKPSQDGKLHVSADITARGLDQAVADRMARNVAINVQKGETIRIADNSSSPGPMNFTVDYVIQVPLELKEIRVKTSAGNFTAEGISGDLVVDHRVGNVEVMNHQGQLTVASSTGNVKVGGVKGDLSLSHQIGNVDINNPAGKVTVENKTGDVRLSSQQPLQKEYRIQNNIGTVDIELPQTSDLKINADSKVGDVKGNLPWVGQGDESPGHGRRSASLGKGTGLMDLQVSSGSIKVNMK